MDANDYLNAVLESQTLASDSDEIKELTEKRQEVEGVLRAAFPGADLAIRYGGSKAKGTMIRASYDLDITSYFGHDETQAGETLENIYKSVREALSQHYYVDSSGKTAIKLRELGEQGTYLHIDVVPGRFTDDTETDVFLYQHQGDKERLKTNLDTHIKHIKDSGLTDTIKLVKFWRECYGFYAKTFIIELLVVEVLSAHKSKDVNEQLIFFWQYLSDDIEDLSIEDPANPSGNDLSGLLDAAKPALQIAAQSTLQTIENTGWEAVFGAVGDRADEATRAALTDRLPQVRGEGAKPWVG